MFLNPSYSVDVRKLVVRSQLWLIHTCVKLYLHTQEKECENGLLLHTYLGVIHMETVFCVNAHVLHHFG